MKDNVDVDITYQINGLPAANESENVFVPIGIHTVTLTASDESGNEAEVVTFTVEVSDQDAPVISLEGASSLSIAYGESYIEPGYKAMDNVDGDITERVEVTGEVGSEIGDYTLKYNVTDEAGNDAEEVLRTITIVDLAAPVLSIPQDIIVAAVDAKGAPASTESITTFLNAATATDLVDGVVDVTVSVEDGEGNRAEIPENFPLGETNVVFSASDFATPSNTTELVAVVSVRDLTKPVLTLVNPGSITVSLGSEYIDPGYNAVDNVDGDLTAKIVVMGTIDASTAGTYTLRYDVSDAAGNAAEPVSRTVVVEKSTVTQGLSLKAGWNLVSFYVEPEDAAPATVLASIMDKLVQIKNLTSSYDPSLPFFLNTLTSLNVKDGYWVKVKEAVSLEVEGALPAGASITVKKGWNLVGYPRESGEAPASELASLGSTVVQIKNLTSSYDPALPFFLNTLTTMAPGLGYWLKVTENGTWTVGDVSESGSGRDIAKASNEGGPEWGPAVVYPTVSATVFAQVTVAGKAVSKGSVVGVYVGDELRGQHEVVLANGRSYATLNVNLAEAERVTYRIWDAESDKEYRVAQSMTLQMGETYGSAAALVKLDGLVPSVGVRILSYTRSPFGLEFESEAGREYVVEATGDLREWKPVQTLQGTSERTRFTPEQEPKAPVRYFRVRME